jgi:putative protein kinase ArgK-like GTPase of G3E family
VLEFRENARLWKPPVTQTVANSGQGIDDLLRLIEEHSKFQDREQIRIRKQKDRIMNYVRQIIQERILKDFWQPSLEEKLKNLIELIIERKKSPYAVGAQLIEEFKNNICS